MLDGPTLAVLRRKPLGQVLCAGFPELHWSTGEPWVQGAAELLGRLGMTQMQVVDLVAGRTDLIHDLSRPLPGGWDETCDTVLDCGTVEHVANATECLWNYARVLRVGGRLVVSTVYNNFGGHGYWQLTPQFMYDFLEANGFEGVEVAVYSPFWFWPRAVKRLAGQRWTWDTPMLMVVSGEKAKPLGAAPVWPVQQFWGVPYRAQGWVRGMVRWGLCRVARWMLGAKRT